MTNDEMAQVVATELEDRLGLPVIATRAGDEEDPNYDFTVDGYHIAVSASWVHDICDNNELQARALARECLVRLPI